MRLASPAGEDITLLTLYVIDCPGPVAVETLFRDGPMDIMTTPYIYTASAETFEEYVIKASNDRPILVDLWAEWCPPCLVIGPILEAIVHDYAGAIALVKIEVDEGDNMKIAGSYRVRGFPTILLIEAGEERGRFSSARPAQFIRDFIAQHSRLPTQVV